MLRLGLAALAAALVSCALTAPAWALHDVTLSGNAVRTQRVSVGDHRWYTLEAQVQRTLDAQSSIGLDCGGRDHRTAVPALDSAPLRITVAARADRRACTVTLRNRGGTTSFAALKVSLGHHRLSVLGADVSSLAKSEDLGGVYGYWHGTLADLQCNVDDVATHYGQDVIVAETAYPFTLPSDDGLENIIFDQSQLVPGYAATPEGQAAWLRDLLTIVRAVPDGRGLGAFWWDATWTVVDGNGWSPRDPQSGNGWENQALFDYRDRVLPAADEFRR